MGPGCIFVFLLTVGSFSEASLGREVARDDRAEQKPDSRDLMIMTQATAVEEIDSAYQSELDLFLEEDDVAAAKLYVEGLFDADKITRDEADKILAQIESFKTARLKELTAKVVRALVTSDHDSVNLYNERMRRLNADIEFANDRPESAADNIPAKQETATAPVEAAPDPAEIAKAAEEKKKAEQQAAIKQQLAAAATALRENRLLPPTSDNAFNLATGVLAIQSNNLAAQGVLDGLFAKQKDKLTVSLQNNQPDEALRAVQQLRRVLDGLKAETSWLKTYQSNSSGWIREVTPDIVQKLDANAKDAIEVNHLAVAPPGQLSAMDYASLIASELGTNNSRVTELVRNVLKAYDRLIDRSLERQAYGGASALHERMEEISSQYKVGADLTKRQERKIAISAEYNELLSQARLFRGRGQLIRPTGGNAIETVKKAMQLDTNHDVAETLLEELVYAAQVQIGYLVNENRTSDAARDLQLLGDAMRDIDPGIATTYYAAADRLISQNEGGDADASPSETESSDDTPFTFTNPF